MAKRDKPEGVVAEVLLGERQSALPLPELRSPDEWCRALGEGRELYRLGARKVWQPGWRHAAAVVLHGWHKHAHHAGSPILLSRGDYEAALIAASTAEGMPAPHAPVLSPHAGKMI